MNDVASKLFLLQLFILKQSNDSNNFFGWMVKHMIIDIIFSIVCSVYTLFVKYEQGI